MEIPFEFKNRMKDMLGAEYEDFSAALESDVTFRAFRVNRKKEIPPELESLVKGLEKVEWCENGYYAERDILDGNSPYHLGGAVYFQEPSAMAVVPALGIEPGDYLLDLCAAPGGKATHAAEYLGDDGILVANEIVKKRSTVLADNLDRMGVKNAIVTNESPKRLEERFEGFFNKIIVDAPCSGEGMFRKEPRAVEEWSEGHTRACAERQKLILESALKMLAPGGKLIYSTCTFAPAENEGVVESLLENHPEMKLLDIDLPGLSPAVADWVGSKRDMAGAKRAFPHRQRGEGHFYALFQKEGEYMRAPRKEKSHDGEEVKLYREFEKKFLNTELSGRFELFGEKLYLAPDGISVEKLKTERAGLLLGRCKKGRFEPEHALALALKKEDFKYTFEPEEIRSYLKGETLSADISGWCAVTYRGLPIGWAKGSGGVLKNHFPKFQRIL